MMGLRWNKQQLNINNTKKVTRKSPAKSNTMLEKKKHLVFLVGAADTPAPPPIMYSPGGVSSWGKVCLD